MPRVDKIQIGNRLQVARADKDMSQSDLADEIGTSQSRISTWERREWIPKGRLDDVCRALDVDPRWLREGVAPEDAGGYVQAEPEVNRWRDAVIDYYGPGDVACQILLALPMEPFLERQNDPNAPNRPADWTVVTTIDEFLEGTGFSEDEVESNCDRILESPFLERYGAPVKWAFRLKFPTDEELERHDRQEGG